MVDKTNKTFITLETVKEDSLESRDSQTLAKFCHKLQIKLAGTKKELLERLLPLKNEHLFDRRVNSICK